MNVEKYVREECRRMYKFFILAATLCNHNHFNCY